MLFADDYKTYGPELDEYGQPVLHYDLKAANKVARDHTAFMEAKMIRESRTVAEWKEHDKIVRRAKKMVDASLEKKIVVITAITCGDIYSGKMHIRAMVEGPMLDSREFKVFEANSIKIEKAPTEHRAFLDWYERYHLEVEKLCKKYDVKYDEDDPYMITDCYIKHLTTERGYTLLGFDTLYTEDR